MPTPSPEIIQLVSTFAVAFTLPTFAKVVVLIYGTVLAPGRRTVAAALRVMGSGNEQHFTNYHRVLNRANWSPWILSKLLLALIIRFFLVAGSPLLLLIDETLERRRGAQIKYKGWFRDAVRSTLQHVSTALGIRWLCLAILVPVPWSQRLWALPFLVIPALSQATSEKLAKRHRTIIGWTILMLDKVRRWQPEREVVLVGDGTYAAIALIQHCQRTKRPVTFVTRLRMDAKLHDFPTPQPPGKSGPKPKKGVRQPSPAERLEDPMTVWQTLRLPWYDGTDKALEYLTGVSLWAKRGETPVPIRWVLVRCPDDKHFKPEVFCCSNTEVEARQILLWAIARWNIEVTFEELRAHLGFETQRQWSDRAIERTTPCLFGLFSLVVVMAKVLHPDTLPVRTAAWYAKTEATFSDALAAVRIHLWQSMNSRRSPENPDLFLIDQATLSSLLEVACYST
jgi:DDE superfamily endonuclease